MDLRVLVTCLVWFIFIIETHQSKESLILKVQSFKQKCCPISESLDYVDGVCVSNNKSRLSYSATTYGFPRCDNSTVLVELKSKRDTFSILGNRSLSVTIATLPYITDLFCTDSTVDSDLWFVFACLEKNVCARIPCIQQCRALDDVNYSTGIPLFRIRIQNNTNDTSLVSTSIYGLINNFNCTECMGKEFALDPNRYPEHEYILLSNGSLYLPHQKKQLSADRFYLRYSEQRKQTQISICFHQLREASNKKYYP